MTDITSITPEQAKFVIKQICKWMNICEDNKRSCSSVDVSHSALLHRLLLGGPLHANPPPTSNSYPCWALVELEEIEILSFFVIEDPDDLMAGDIISINQDSGYSWHDKENKIVVYDRLGIRYQYFERETTPLWVKKGLNPEDMKYMGKFLKRLNDPVTGPEQIWDWPKNE